MAEDKKPPQPKESNESGFSSLLNQLKEDNDGAKIASNTREYEASIQATLADKSLKLNESQRDELERLVSTLQGNKLGDLEKQAEANAIAKETIDLLKGIKDNTEQDTDKIEFEGPGQILAAIVLGIGAAVAGLATGILAGILSNAVGIIKMTGKGLKLVLSGAMTKLAGAFPKTAAFFKGLTTSVKGFFGGLKGGFITKTAKIADNIADAFKPLTKGIKNIKGAFNAGFAGMKSFRTATGQFGKTGFIGRIGKEVARFMAPITKGLTTFKDGIKSLKAPFTTLSKSAGGLSKIKTMLNPVMKFAKVAFKAFGGLGRVFGRLFLPIQLVMGVIDAVKGAMAGFDKYKDQGFLAGLFGGLMGGLGGLLSGIIGMPLDLLKSAVAWVLEKFGFTDAADALGEFSFADMIKNLFFAITDKVLGFIQHIKDQIADIGIGGMVANMAIDILKILKKIAMFPLAVAAGAVMGLAAAWPGGDSPGEAFMKGFNGVMSAGDATLDSMKIQGDGKDENGDDILEKSGENELARKDNIEKGTTNVMANTSDNSTKTQSQTFVMGAPAPNKVRGSLATR